MGLIFQFEYIIILAKRMFIIKLDPAIKSLNFFYLQTQLKFK